MLGIAWLAPASDKVNPAAPKMGNALLRRALEVRSIFGMCDASQYNSNYLVVCPLLVTLKWFRQKLAKLGKHIRYFVRGSKLRNDIVP
jgi:hypothetical protein